MKSLLLALTILPFSLMAQDAPEYMNNDGTAAPEMIDRKVEEGRDRMQREEAEKTMMQKEEAEEDIQRDEVLEREDFQLDESDYQKEVAPDANAQDIHQQEEERVEDNVLIGPYNGKGEYDLPQEEVEEIKKAREESFE